MLRKKPGITKGGKYAPTPKRSYCSADIDAFIFVHIPERKFYVLPARKVNFNRHKITFRPDSPWAEAWWVLKTP
jgi:hypothetical protein